MLSIFDPDNSDTQSQQIINIKEKEYPDKYREVIRRLKMAASIPEVRKVMNTEDEVAEEYKNITDAIALKEKEITEDRRQKENAYTAIRKMVLVLQSQGMELEEIATIVDKSTDELHEILNG